MVARTLLLVTGSDAGSLAESSGNNGESLPLQSDPSNVNTQLLISLVHWTSKRVAQSTDPEERREIILAMSYLIDPHTGDSKRMNEYLWEELESIKEELRILNSEKAVFDGTCD